MSLGKRVSRYIMERRKAMTAEQEVSKRELEAAELKALNADSDHSRIDALEKSMLRSDTLVELQVAHLFTPGLYGRELFLPAGTLATSKIHKTQHPFIILKGKVSVLLADDQVQYIEAPYVGVTEPGTRRVVFAHEDTTWITFHANPDDENAEQIEERIIEKHLLADGTNVHKEFKELVYALQLEGDR